MNSLATDVRQLILKRMATVSTAELISLVDGCNEPVHQTKQRFTKIDAQGKHVSDDASDWVAVYDATRDCTFTAAPIDCGEVNHADAIIAASKLTLFGCTDWTVPSVQQLLSLIDYERSDPVVDTSYFKGPYGWEWTRTTAKSPSGCAWNVSLDFGGSDRLHQSLRAHVRAVRAGQQLTLGM